MKIVKISLAVPAGVIALLLLGSLLLPSRWQVERSIDIGVAPGVVFPYVNDLGKWPEWTSWYQREPKPVTQYSGPSAGAGARSTWQDAGGQGEMGITVSVPDWGITYDLSFEHGEFVARGEILLAPIDQGSGTRVTWRTRGDSGMNPLARYFQRVMSRRTGADFQQSLERLKQMLEAMPKNA
jgi:hypothetical protein